MIRKDNNNGLRLVPKQTSKKKEIVHESLRRKFKELKSLIRKFAENLQKI